MLGSPVVIFGAEVELVGRSGFSHDAGAAEFNVAVAGVVDLGPASSDFALPASTDKPGPATMLTAPGGAASGAGWSIETGVHATLEGRAGYATDRSVWSTSTRNSVFDLSGTVRPLWSAESGKLRFNAEIQIAGQYGDSIERGGDFRVIATEPVEHDLIDLSRNWSRGESHRLDARIDRLAASWTEPWGTVTAGRHAVTWGGGLIFNPFDLFNPFAPADIVRDYKIGADMVHVDLPLSDGGFQALAVGRRNPLNGSVSASASSFAVQWQHRFGNNELFLLAGQHYDEPVLGAGLSGLLGAATWRIDTTWQRVQAEGTGLADSGFSAVANVQYSWLWGGKNIYGFLEYYYNGWGKSDPGEALFDPYLVTQLARGNAFVLGRHYAAASAQVELHPLLSLFVSSIVNLEDPSLLLQPRLTWNTSAQLQLTFGLDIPGGERGTEFGGVELVPTGRTTRAPTTVYCIATWDF